MIFNPRYRTAGLLGLPYFLIFELFGPVVELLGYVAFVAGLLLGVLNVEFALAFFLVAVGLGVLLSTAAVFLEELRLERYPRWRDLLELTAYGILENFGYRQINTVWRVKAIVSYLRKNTEWGAMERKGFEEERRRWACTRRATLDKDRHKNCTSTTMSGGARAGGPAAFRLILVLLVAVLPGNGPRHPLAVGQCSGAGRRGGWIKQVSTVDGTHLAVYDGVGGGRLGVLDGDEPRRDAAWPRPRRARANQGGLPTVVRADEGDERGRAARLHHPQPRVLRRLPRLQLHPRGPALADPGRLVPRGGAHGRGRAGTRRVHPRDNADVQG